MLCNNNTIYAIFVTASVNVMVSVLVLSVIYRGVDPRSSQTKDYKTVICCFSAKPTALRKKNKGWLARNLGNASQRSNILTRGLLFQCARTINIKLIVLVYYKADIIIISSKLIVLDMIWLKDCSFDVKTTITHLLSILLLLLI